MNQIKKILRCAMIFFLVIFVECIVIFLKAFHQLIDFCSVPALLGFGTSHSDVEFVFHFCFIGMNRYFYK